jgi:hypothetical protein
LLASTTGKGYLVDDPLFLATCDKHKNLFTFIQTISDIILGHHTLLSYWREHFANTKSAITFEPEEQFSKVQLICSHRVRD